MSETQTLIIVAQRLIAGRAVQPDYLPVLLADMGHCPRKQDRPNARNQGLAYDRGELLCFFDDDDEALCGANADPAGGLCRGNY
jgi:hypothetical protein